MNARPNPLTPWRYFRRRFEDPYGKWVMLACGWAIIALGIFDLVTANDMLQALAGVAVGAMGFNFFIAPRLYRNAFRRGYFEARSVLVHSWQEAQSRGLSLEEWIQGEAERDFMVMLDHLQDNA